MKASAGATARGQLLAILLVTGASLGGAWLLFHLARDGEPWATTNQGRFVEPATAATDLGLRSADGVDFATDGAWWIWVAPDGACETACNEALHQVRQLHVLLNRDAARVRRALLLAPGLAAPQLADRYPRLTLLSGNLGSLPGGIYLVDPLGNLVLHYPMEDAGEPVLNDLKRLLKVSQIG